MITIYTLIDPRNYEIRYVGKTKKSLTKRVSNHVYIAKQGGKAQRFIWLRKILRMGLYPIVSVVQEIDEKNWEACETYWVSYFKSIGCNLVNNTNGGGGTNGCVRKPWSDDAKKKHSLTIREIHKKNPTLKEKISINTKLGMKEYLKDHKNEFADKVSKGNLKRYESIEAKMVTSIASKKTWESKDRRKALSDKQKELIAREPKSICPTCGMTSRRSNITRHRKINNH